MTPKVGEVYVVDLGAKFSKTTFADASTSK